MSLVYVDTSVLVKRYLHTPVSERVERLFDRDDHDFVLSELTWVEMESTLQQQSRSRKPKLDVAALRVRFHADVNSGFFRMAALDRHCALSAARLVAESATPVATLDALHLASALQVQAQAFATDDRQLARAAKANGMTVISFV